MIKICRIGHRLGRMGAKHGLDLVEHEHGQGNAPVVLGNERSDLRVLQVLNVLEQRTFRHGLEVEDEDGDDCGAARTSDACAGVWVILESCRIVGAKSRNEESCREAWRGG